MPLTERRLAKIQQSLPGIKSAIILPGLYDFRPAVLAPHVQAASDISAAHVSTDVHVIGHHQGRRVAENVEPVIIEMQRRAKRGPFVVFATSAGGVYAALAATHLPEKDLDNFSGAVLLSPRVNSSQSLERARGISPSFADAVELLEGTWEDVSPDVQRKFAIVVNAGDQVVPRSASELAGARMIDATYVTSHDKSIEHSLTTGLEKTVSLALAA